ncbi:MAG: CDP-alcohol phosphatidyltransferase family protein [Promethearchaeota archaeon]
MTQEKYLNSSIQINKIHKITTWIPNLLSISRIITSPFLTYFIVFDFLSSAIVLFIINIITDIIDGKIARKYDSCSNLGEYLDIFGDISSIVSIFIGFTVKEVFPFWILAIVLVIFLQFLITSRNEELLYDPIGKYYGTFLFGMLLATLLDFNNLITLYTIMSFTCFTILSVSSRIDALYNKRMRN